MKPRTSFGLRFDQSPFPRKRWETRGCSAACVNPARTSLFVAYVFLFLLRYIAMKSVCAPAVAVTPARQLVSRTFAPARGRERAVFYGGKHKTGRSSCHVEKYGGSLVHHMEIRSISARRVILPANDARFAVGDPEIITGRGVILRAEKKTQASLTRRGGAAEGERKNRRRLLSLPNFSNCARHSGSLVVRSLSRESYK